MAAGAQVHCGSCDCMVDKDNTFTVRKADHARVEQVRCKPCHALRSRITRLINSTGVEGFSELSDEQRIQLMKGAAELFGADLKKEVTEAIIKSKVERQTIAFSSGGEFEDWDVVEERYKNKPEEWASIQLNARTFTCTVRKVKMVQIPKYQSTDLKEEILGKEQKRKIEGYGDIKKTKKTKIPTPVRATLSEDNVPVNVPVGEKQLERADKIVNQLKETEINMGTLLSLAKAEEAKDYVTHVTVTKAEKAMERLQVCIAIFNTYIEKKEAPKGAFTSRLSDAKSVLNEILDVTKRIDAMLADKEEAEKMVA
jgi:hypothetical protein